MQSPLQNILSQITRRMPRFPGLGRCVIAADSLCGRSDARDGSTLLASVNDGCLIKVDGRVLEQKFAFYYGEWEHELIGASLRHYSGGAFYDIGGSIGLYAVAVGRHCRTHGGFVRTFEPFPANLQRLRDNLELNGLTECDVKIHPIALNNAAGTLRVALVADGLPGNAKVVQNGGTEVLVRTLDDVWTEAGREPVGFIKIDTEGYDGQVLLGAAELLKECRPAMLVEFNRERMTNLGFSFPQIWGLLTRDLGYRAFEIDGRGRAIQVTDPGHKENLLFLSDANG